jgi:hypothetical protein
MNKHTLRRIVSKIKPRGAPIPWGKVQELTHTYKPMGKPVDKPKEVKALEQWLDRGKNDT